ncbi:MAG: dihydrodipicolinate synthase family protein, partial [Oscillospiraceae bacterium]|nr:dihydrodipicolinate synthase family protein [Oscillospiraceae bacterium]
MGRVLFTGVLSALVSPLREDGNINEETTRKLLRWQLDAGLAGFYVCGATGEGVVMRPAARKRLTEIAVEEAKGRGAVIAHVGAVDMATAMDLAAHAAQAGADAISSVPPFFYPYGLPEIARYYTALAEASGLPTLIYASPMAGTVFTRDMVAALLEIPGIVGLKWTSPDYYAMSRIKQLAGGDINVINGPDETLLCGLCMGADGGIGSTYNVMPGTYAEL